MYWQWIAGVIAGLVLLDLAFRLYSVRLILRIFHKQLPLRVEAVHSCADVERVEIPSSCGVTLRGGLYRSGDGPARGVIVFCPELNGSHWSAANYCHGLIESGFDVLAFDFRNQGESDALEGYRPLHWVTNHETDDVQAALRFVRSRDDLNRLPVGLMGVSRGGGAALAVAAENAGVACVATEGAFSTEAMHLHYTLRWATVYVPHWFLKLIPAWHTKSTLFLCRVLSELIRRCRYAKLPQLLPRLRDRPVLLIAGRADSYVPMTIAEELADQIGGTNRELWKVHRAKHNQARQVERESYDEKLTAFFDGMTGPVAGLPASAAEIGRALETVLHPEPTAST